MALPVIARVRVGAGRLAAAVAGGGDRSRPRMRGLAGVRIGLKLRGNMVQESRRIGRLMREHDHIIAMALNRAGRSGRTETIRTLADFLNVPQRTLRKRIRLYGARWNRKPIRSSIWVGTKKPIKAGELRGQVSLSASGHVKIGKRIYRQAFPATMPGGHRGIFVRKPGARHRQRSDGVWTQLPIEEGVVPLMPDAERISRREAERALKTVYPAELRRLARVRLQMGGF